MKLYGYRLIIFLSIVSATSALAGGSLNKSSCTYNGKKLYGKVQVVNNFPDIKVQEVSSIHDLKVEKVSSFADKCGNWAFVSSIADLKVQFVSSLPDIKIEYVNSNPGFP